MVLQRRPLYRTIFERYLEFQKGISVTLEAPELEAPLRNLPFLYQLWCTLNVIQVATRVASDRGFRVQRSALFQRNEGFLSLRLSQTAATFVHPETDVRIRVIPERYYGRGSGDALRSISYGQRPDLAVEVIGPTGDQAVYLFDPKYKLDAEQSEEDMGEEGWGTPKKPDIDKMHAYRDAIRGAEGQRVVRYAAILYPGDTESFSVGLEAVCARPDRPGLLRKRLERVMKRALRGGERMGKR
jgi:hypothetical protein